MNWTPYLSIWSAFAAIVLGLAIYRKKLSLNEDDSLHVTDASSSLISQQAAAAHRIEVIEKWGKSLTAVFVLAGLAMLFIYLRSVWLTGSGIPLEK